MSKKTTVAETLLREIRSYSGEATVAPSTPVVKDPEVYEVIEGDAAMSFDYPTLLKQKGGGYKKPKKQKKSKSDGEPVSDGIEFESRGPSRSEVLLFAKKLNQMIQDSDDFTPEEKGQLQRDLSGFHQAVRKIELRRAKSSIEGDSSSLIQEDESQTEMKMPAPPKDNPDLKEETLDDVSPMDAELKKKVDKGQTLMSGVDKTILLGEIRSYLPLN